MAVAVLSTLGRTVRSPSGLLHGFCVFYAEEEHAVVRGRTFYDGERALARLPSEPGGNVAVADRRLLLFRYESGPPGSGTSYGLVGDVHPLPRIVDVQIPQTAARWFLDHLGDVRVRAPSAPVATAAAVLSRVVIPVAHTSLGSTFRRIILTTSPFDGLLPPTQGPTRLPRILIGDEIVVGRR